MKRAKVSPCLKKIFRMVIGNCKIGEGASVFIIAELSANHNGSLRTAIDTIKAVKRAGADWVHVK